jgi:hypothetical protein
MYSVTHCTEARLRPVSTCVTTHVLANPLSEGSCAQVRVPLTGRTKIF